MHKIIWDVENQLTKNSILYLQFSSSLLLFPSFSPFFLIFPPLCPNTLVKLSVFWGLAVGIRAGGIDRNSAPCSPSLPYLYLSSSNFLSPFSFSSHFYSSFLSNYILSAKNGRWKKNLRLLRIDSKVCSRITNLLRKDPLRFWRKWKVPTDGSKSNKISINNED